ncbi:unnamed protein product [Mycena citricolor]|uniref:EXPERA domain-containing protein n=1 Tax=Mycena citricolor TaxID=2018698 RepID=A0AAD2GVL2_9AGAR|nr:unnamed protein product [Mycena citricolor]
MPATGLLLLSTLFPIAQVFAAPKGNIPRPADPFLDPKHDVFNPLRYIASNVLTGIAFETGLVYKRGARFMLSMVIGCYTFAIGFGTRFGLHSNPEGKGLYIVEYLFIVLSPCAFIASEYVLLGRLARYLECDRHLMVPARRITKIFVSSDITTFLIQVRALPSRATSQPGSILPGCRRRRVCVLPGAQDQHRQARSLAGPNPRLTNVHSGITYLPRWACPAAGLLPRVHHRVRGFPVPSVHARQGAVGQREQHEAARLADPGRCYGAQLPRHPRAARSLHLPPTSLIRPQIRSLYRVIELSQGYVGHLATDEALFYALGSSQQTVIRMMPSHTPPDTLPLFLAIAVYVFVWPGNYIGDGTPPIADQTESTKDTELAETH